MFIKELFSINALRRDGAPTFNDYEILSTHFLNRSDSFFTIRAPMPVTSNKAAENMNSSIMV